MAYTVTVSGNDATAVGTSGRDILAITDAGDVSGKITFNSFEGDDTITIDAGPSSGTIGMGAGTDGVDFAAITESVNVTLGDGKDTFTTSAGVSDKITVGGQGGADTFTLTVAPTNSRFGGGQGKDTFTGTLGSKSTIVGGSEDDTINITGAASNFVNGQIGKDDIDYAAAANATVRGGSEDDTVTVTGDANAMFIAGDKGADALVDAAGDNTLTGGGGKDTLTGGGGKDTLIGGLGIDRFVQTDGATAKISAETTTAAGIKTGDTLTAAADVITDFKSGIDKLEMTSKAGGIVNLAGLGTGSATAINANSVAFLRGDFAATTGVFTVDTASGADTLVLRQVAAVAASADLTLAVLGANANTSVTILDNYTSFAATDLA